MPKNSANVSVGRLLEVRADAGYRTTADVDAIFEAIGREAGRVPPGSQLVTVVDWRNCPLMSPDAAEHMLKKMAGNNVMTLRSAVIASEDSPMAVLQFVRLIRDARLPDRRLFFDRHELVSWLAGVLTSAERQRLVAFLAEAQTPSIASAS